MKARGLWKTVAAVTMAMAATVPCVSAAEPPFPGADASVVAAAQKEGQLTIYGVLVEDIMNPTIAAFQKAVPGIEVHYLKRPSTPLANRFAEEEKSGAHAADLVSVSVPAFYNNNPDWFVKLTPENVPTLANAPDGVAHPNFVDTINTAHQIAYNSDLVTGADVPKDWPDVLNPKFADRGIMVDPRSSNTYMSWLWLIYKNYGPDFLTKLKEQNFTYVSSATQGVQEVAAGGSLISFPAGQTHIEPVLKMGAPVGVARPWENGSKMPAEGPVISWGVPVHAPHPNAAIVFLSWLLTPDAQKIFCGGSNASFWLDNADRGQCQANGANFQAADLHVPDADRDKMIDLLGIN